MKASTIVIVNVVTILKIDIDNLIISSLDGRSVFLFCTLRQFSRETFSNGLIIKKFFTTFTSITNLKRQLKDKMI